MVPHVSFVKHPQDIEAPSSGTEAYFSQSEEKSLGRDHKAAL